MREKEYIYLQIMLSFQNAINHYLSSDAPTDELQNEIDKVRDYDIVYEQSICESDFHLPKYIAKALGYIWKNDERLHGIFDKHLHESEQKLEPTTEYYLNDLDRIAAPEYVPNMKDLINLRNMTTGNE